MTPTDWERRYPGRKSHLPGSEHYEEQHDTRDSRRTIRQTAIWGDDMNEDYTCRHNIDDFLDSGLDLSGRFAKAMGNCWVYKDEWTIFRHGESPGVST